MNMTIEPIEAKNTGNYSSTIITLEQALEAMNTLNAWAKNQQAVAPRKAIYWLKSNYAIRDAVMAGMLTKMRVVQVTAKCNRCRNGIYIDWDGESRGACYTCNGTAKVTLKFVETEIAGKYRWHSPVQHRGWQGWHVDDVPAVPAEDWTVGNDGIELPVQEQARLLNIVEFYWPQWRTRSPYDLGREEWDSSRYHYFKYSLNIGRSARGCVLCGGAHHTFAGVTIAPGLEYSRSICEPCSKCLDNLMWKQLLELPLPDLHPEIQKWMARHAIDFERGWQRHWTDAITEESYAMKYGEAAKNAALFKV